MPAAMGARTSRLIAFNRRGVTLGSINAGPVSAADCLLLAQDNYKFRPNLTLIAGLRWEFDQPWYEQNNKTGTVDLATGQILYAAHIPTGAPADAGLCDNRACYQPNFRPWMPHVGVRISIQ